MCTYTGKKDGVALLGDRIKRCPRIACDIQNGWHKILKVMLCLSAKATVTICNGGAT